MRAERNTERRLCVCARARVRVGEFVCVRVVLGARVRACICVRVAFLVQHAKRRHIIVCGLSGSTIFFDIFSYTAWFSVKKFMQHKLCVLILSTNFYLQYSLFQEEFSEILS
jgi:hypothetical protein